MAMPRGLLRARLFACRGALVDLVRDAGAGSPARPLSSTSLSLLVLEVIARPFPSSKQRKCARNRALERSKQ